MKQKPYANLTEDSIKVTVLRHLKSYYRNAGEGDELMEAVDKEDFEGMMELHKNSSFKFINSGLDYSGEGGIIVDGFISFPAEDGKVFLATFEATAYDQRKELMYQPQQNMLFWDSMAVASLTSAAIFIFFHVQKIYFLYFFGSFLAIFWGLAAFGLIFLFYYYFFNWFSISRYRYIYAIEQFKRYYAQDQWVAFSEDVFPDLSSKYYVELKRQCVKNGVGLIKVDRAMNCKFLYTAAKEDTFKIQRNHIRLKAQQANISNEDMLPVKKGLLSKFLDFFPKDKHVNLLRFMKIPRNQFAVSAFGLVTILTFLGIQWYNGPIRYVNELRYEKKLTAKIKKLNRESVYYIIDTPIKPGEFDTSGLEESDYIIRHIDRKVEGNIIVPESEMAKSEKGIIMADDNATTNMLFYDCERFANNVGKFYLVTDTIVPSFDMAVTRINYLKSAGLRSTALWRGCLFGFDDSYILYFDDILVDSLEAASLRDYYRKMDIDGRLGLHPEVTVFIGN